MKGLVYKEQNLLEWREVPDVFPKDNEVKIKCKAVGICGSDVHGYLGLTGRRTPPMIMGHEFSGIVVEVGKDVKAVKVGDRVAPYPVDFCDECDMCINGNVHLCYNRKQFGVLNVDGAFADYICVPEKVCFHIADNVSYSVGSLMEPLAVAYRGVAHLGDIKDKTILIVGSGTIGLLALACIKMKEAGKVIVSDLSDERLKTAKLMGADIVINPTKEDMNDVINQITNGTGVDISIEAVGTTASVRQAISALSFGGTAVWIGNSKKIIEINMQEVVTHELKIMGSFLYGFMEFRTVVELLNKEKLNVQPLISLEAPMHQGAEMFDKLVSNPGSLIKVILTAD